MKLVELKTLMVVAALTSCAGGNVVTSEEAKSIADNALEAYCRTTAQGDCKSISFVGATQSKEGWLVEYKAEAYLHAVLVKKDGSTELSRLREGSG